ncbi:MAG: hypothetical protein AAFR61_24830 [Bacteroidota bacterium]
MEQSKQQILTQLFMETGHAHHQAFLATDGADPEWPLWYAEYLKEKLPSVLAQPMTKSRLIHELVWLEDTADVSKRHWTEVYAEMLVIKYPH